MVFSIHDSQASLFDGGKFFLIQSAHLIVGTGGSKFYHSEGFYIIRVELGSDSAYREVFKCPRSLYTIVGICRDLFFPQQVLLGPGLRIPVKSEQ